MRAKYLLALGNLEPARLWAQNSGLAPEDAQVSHAGMRELAYQTLARILYAQARYVEASSLLERLYKAAESEERKGSVIENLALLSILYQSQEMSEQAMSCLEFALTLAEPEGYLRVFVDEGESMRNLLVDYQRIAKQRIGEKIGVADLRLLTYCDRLLAAFSSSELANSTGPRMLYEALSERELDILRLIATGRSNQEIAEILTIAVSTVKSHVNSLYGKLGIHRRTQAVSIARELGVLSG